MSASPEAGSYVSFNTYRISNGIARLIRVVRSYSTRGDFSPWFPFVTTITVIVKDDKGNEKKVDYFELRNSNNDVIFVTDESGISTLFSGSIAVPA